ncbi:MAG: PQQ-dependent sugar dehydrogenase [Proteobacteria bacterium]|nr:PQQ-dependent sugar dehydrogenase [Pseudomonadota bacterium]
MTRRLSFAVWLAGASVAAATALAVAVAVAQTQQAFTTPVVADATRLPDQQIGRHFSVRPRDLPPPYSGPVAANRPVTIPYAGQVPRVPPGFTVTAFVTGLAHPRRLLVLPNGDVLVAEQKAGYLTLLSDHDGDGKAEKVERYAEGFNGPYGLAWRDGDVLVADQDGIWKAPRKPAPHVDARDMITRKGVFGVARGHANRHLTIDPRNGALLVGVGSIGNIDVEPEVKATIQRFERDGSGQSTYASGMRNPTALAFEPGTGDLYALVQERDGLGDNLVPDYMTRVEKGAFYGWPYSYIGKNPQPGFAQMRPDKVQSAVVPDLLFQAHSSLLDLVFYTGDQFPSEYRGGAFVALKGSWNRSEPTGYKVVYVPFKASRPQGDYINFMTGFWASGGRRAEVWGRPAALAVTKDGALLVADDTGGTIWRVAYTGAGR